MKRLLTALLLLLVVSYPIPLKAQHITLVSSGATTQIWESGSWVTPTQIADKDANAGAPGATLVERGWGWNCGCERYGDTAKATTDCAWQSLYDEGSHWISDSTWYNNYTSRYSRQFHHNFTIPAGYFAKNLKVVVACDDSVHVLMDDATNPPWTTVSSYYKGTAVGYCELTTIDIGCVESGNHSIQFILINRNTHYFGFIYKIEYDLVAYNDDVDIEQEGDCCYSGSFTYFDSSGSSLTDFSITPITSGIIITGASVTGSLQENDWTASYSSTSARYSGGSAYSNCSEVETFHFCIDSYNANPFDLIIRYFKGGDLIRTDTISNIPTDSCCGCDDIKFELIRTSVPPDSGNAADCCYKFGFSSDCDLSRIEFVRFTLPSGVSFSGTPTAPSGFTGGPTTWRFPNPPGNFVAGTYQWFNFCFTNNTGSAAFPLYITFTDGNYEPICSDSILIKCKQDSIIEFGECTSIKFNPDSSSNGYIDLPSSSVYAVPNSSSGFTWECWFKLNKAPTGALGWGEILINIDKNNPYDGQDITLSFGSPLTPRDQLTFWVENVSTHSNFVSFKPPVTGFIPNRWYHVAVVIDYGNKNIRMVVYDAYNDNTYYITGTFYSSSTPIPGPFTPRIGHWGGPLPSGNGDFFDGWMDDIRFWSTPCSNGKIAENRKKCFYEITDFPPGVTALKAYYPILPPPNDMSPGTIHDLASALNGISWGGSLMTQPPASNAAPMNCCDSICCCKDMQINFNKIAPLADSSGNKKCDCCYELNFKLNCENRLFDSDIETIRFSLPNGETFCLARPPSASWMPGWPFNASTRTWRFPPPSGHLIPNVSYGNFTFCFEGSSAGTPFPLIVDFMDGNYSVICEDTLWPNCGTQDCCENFDSLKVDTHIFHLWGGLVYLHGLITDFTVPPKPMKRISATVVFAQKNWGAGPNAPRTFADIVRAKGNIPPWLWATPPTFNSSLGGLQGIFGTYRQRFSRGREVFWGGLRATSTTGIFTSIGVPFDLIIGFPTPTVDIPQVKFAIRYVFTDITCCSCDTLVYYKLNWKNRGHGIPWKIKENTDNLASPGNYTSSESPARLLMSSRQNGILDIMNTSDNQDESYYEIIGLQLRAEDGISPTSIVDKSTNKSGTVIDGTATIDTEINPGEIGSFDVSFDNQSKDIFSCLITLKLILYPTKDTVMIPLDTLKARYNQGGDIVNVDTSKQVTDVNTFALYLQNLNAGKEDVAKIIISPKDESKLLALGSDAITKGARLDIIKSDSGTYIIPLTIEDYEQSSVKPDSILSPIYITVQGSGQEEIVLEYQTLNAHDEVISTGEIVLQPFTVVEEGPGDLREAVNLSIYPNPVKEQATLQVNSQLDLHNVSLALIDLNGNNVMNIFGKEFIGKGASVFTLDFGSLPSGVYYVRLVASGRTYVKKIIITK